MFIDRAGLNRAISLAVGLWSCAGIATGFTRGLGGLVACRAVLGASEAAGIPAAGIAIGTLLAPAERAMGNALNQAGVSLGSMAALPLAAWLAGTAGWRTAFLITGALGLVWIPLWNLAARPPPVGLRRGQFARHGGLLPVDQLDHAVSCRCAPHRVNPSRALRADTRGRRAAGGARGWMGIAAPG
jgi:MFS family permease